MTEKIPVLSNAMQKNNEAASRNRALFESHNLRVLNFVSSPGAGKTSLLEHLGRRYGSQLGIITGDIQMTFDADRLNASGAKALQIETGGTCHLTAPMIEQALASFDLSKLRYLIIENIGNLICPSSYDLGEAAKVAMLSVTEGDEKPAKYPSLFTRAQAVVINKIDLLPYVSFDVTRAEEDCRKLNNNVKFFRISCRTGEGLDDFFAYFEALKGPQ
jgi:hydrogenase nickel incorporation protein HypB